MSEEIAFGPDFTSAFPAHSKAASTPDFINTFPPHCMIETEGAEYIDETRPYGAGVVEWDGDKAQAIFMYESDLFTVHDAREIAQRGLDLIIHKDKFDVFTGNPFTDTVLDAINPDRVVVYGVATNVCVNYAVKGLLERNREVYVVEDAIKELPGIPNPVNEWYALGAKRTTTKELEALLE